ncbi:hypothetical protein GF108_17320 [Phyllobacterium sp. SYP-B3895]|uniref:hypothetical protein n=1 Tax=Phyllobacterium sp. SYP-B3895 TaxID=2663240 RepID=UPI0012997AB4|nr:hypothetical protein [Phyllobacterium sp. SYP-B3895]MRG57337.1 hypothetical protein [Phyllobacterium sp. SYP-B3895]
MNIHYGIVCNILSILLVLVPFSPLHAQETDLDLIQGYHSRDILVGLPDTSGPFTVISRNADPQTFSATVEYGGVDARAIVSVNGVRASNVAGMYPVKDGPDDPVVRSLLDQAFQYHSSQPNQVAQRTNIGYGNRAMACVSSDDPQKKDDFLVCATGVLGRYMLIQPVMNYRLSSKEVVDRQLADFASAMASAISELALPPASN